MSDPDRDIVLTPDDARKCGFCGSGITATVGPHGFNLKDFIAGKYTVGMAEDLNNAFTNRIAKAARERVARERGE